MSLHKSTPSSNFPADLDLIQSTTNCAMLTGSWPDLSEPQRQMLHNSGMYKMFYDDHYSNDQNKFDEDGDGEQVVYESRLNQNALTSTNSNTNWDENENEEESALLNENRAKEQIQRKTLENSSARNVVVRTTSDGTATQLLVIISNST